MVRKAARTVKSLEKPQTESPNTRTRSRRRKKSESEPESELDVSVSTLKNESSDESEQEYEKKTRRSTRSKKNHKTREMSPTSDDDAEKELKEKKSRKGKSKTKEKNNRKSQSFKDSDTQDDNMQVNPLGDETQDTSASNLTVNLNSEDQQADHHDDDSADNAQQSMETMVFSSVTVDGESTSETVLSNSAVDETNVADPLADPLELQNNAETVEQAEVGVQESSTTNEVCQQTAEKSNITLHSDKVSGNICDTEGATSPVTEQLIVNSETQKNEEQNNSSTDQNGADGVQVVDKPSEKGVTITNDQKIQQEAPVDNKPADIKPSKKIQLKRPLSEKKATSEKSEDIHKSDDTSKKPEQVVSEKLEDSHKSDKIDDETDKDVSVETHEEQVPVSKPEELKRESSSKRKITLKRPSDARQTSVEEAKKPVPVEHDIQHSEAPSIDENNVDKATENKDAKEDGEWSSTYEANGQDESPQKTVKENQTEKSSRTKISLKRRPTTDEREKTGESRDRERRRSHRDSESDFEIKKRPSRTLDRSVSESEEKIIKSVKPKKPTKVVKINRSVIKPVSQDSETLNEDKTQSETNENSADKVPSPKKYKWGSAEVTLRDKRVDLNTVKQVCPSVEFLKEDEVDLELSSLEKRRMELKQRKLLALEQQQEGSEEVESEPIAQEERENILAKNRNISIVDDTASKLKPPPTPAKNPVSNIIFVSNLVRPFTVRQLRDLLERTGTIKEDGFWTDKIKSKCFVVYETPEEAEATRNALHGVNWPIGNGKQLSIEYYTEEEMEKVKNPPPPVRREKTPEKENKIPETLDDIKIKNAEAGPPRDWDKRRESGGDRTRDSDGHRRGHSGAERDERRHSRSRSRERARKYSRRSATPEDHHQKKKKHEEPVEQKAMDDLFMKTKATPSIYWQPLSPEEIAQKQRQREARLEENRRRMEERRPANSNYRDRNFRRR